MPPPARSQFVICLAGHIDHGKSALVRALTGKQVDRLPEEQRRGITIDLGFAHFDAGGSRFALIDVPGHERFIHAMVAGVSGVDAAILVVAADDSVMPQTREHFALLQLLGVRHGVIAITKCDLVSAEHLDLVDLELADLVAGTTFADAGRIRVSAHTGSGVEELRQALIELASTVPPRAAGDSNFRMPIDRSFSPAGQGAVVTGTVWRGTARVGESLEILPAGEVVRIRRLQSQGTDVDSVSAGERAAINLVGIKASSIGRGDELTTPDTLKPGRRHLVQLRVLADAAHGLKHRQLVRLHLGAAQATAQILLDQRQVAPGQTAFAVLRCKEPVVAEYGQPFVLRQLSPATTLGGGQIIGPALRPSDRFARCLSAAPGMASADFSERLAAYVGLRREVTVDEISESSLGMNSGRRAAAIQNLLQRKEILSTAGPHVIYVTFARFRQLQEKLLARLRQELERRRPASRVPSSVILAAMKSRASDAVLEALLKAMIAARELLQSGERIGLASGAELSLKQRQLLDKLLAEFAAAGRAPPTDKELTERHQLPPRELAPLLQVGVDDGQLVRLSPNMAIDRDAIDDLRQSLAGYFERHPTAKVGELREQWGITRKHAVPIFEFFDDCRITLRQGDLRTAGPRLTTPIGEAPA